MFTDFTKLQTSERSWLIESRQLFCSFLHSKWRKLKLQLGKRWRAQLIHTKLSIDFSERKKQLLMLLWPHLRFRSSQRCDCRFDSWQWLNCYLCSMYRLVHWLDVVSYHHESSLWPHSVVLPVPSTILSVDDLIFAASVCFCLIMDRSCYLLWTKYALLMKTNPVTMKVHRILPIMRKKASLSSPSPSSFVLTPCSVV